jgi:predicted HTH domain antitoxin
VSPKLGKIIEFFGVSAVKMSDLVAKVGLENNTEYDSEDNQQDARNT